MVAHVLEIKIVKMVYFIMMFLEILTWSDWTSRVSDNCDKDINSLLKPLKYALGKIMSERY